MKSRLLSLVSVFMLIVSGNVLAGDHSSSGHKMDADVVARGSWVRLVPSVSNNSAAYMMLHNKGRRDQIVTRASSPIAEAVEIHQTLKKDGMMTMSEVKRLKIPAEGFVTMEPGGYHIMLINLTRPLKAGERVPVTIGFESGAVIEMQVPVKAMQGGQGKMKKHNH